MASEKAVQEVFMSMYITRRINDLHPKPLQHRFSIDEEYSRKEKAVYESFQIWECIFKWILWRSGRISLSLHLVSYFLSILVISEVILMDIFLPSVAWGVLIGLIGLAISTYLSNLQTLVRSRTIAHNTAQEQIESREEEIVEYLDKFEP